MLNRRRFLQSLAVAATAPVLPISGRAADSELGQLRPDSGKLLDLPKGFSYRVLSRAGDKMDDGLTVPHAHDGMGAFSGAGDRIVLVCNHELEPAYISQSAFGPSFAAIPRTIKDRVYDLGGDSSPGTGGTTTTIYNPVTGETERQFLSLAGTELNCGGGPTPWGSWLSCEECFKSAGTGWSAGRIVKRDKPHGYVFEVPASANKLVDPQPIKSMGRFEHEAAAVHEASGIVFMTEDRRHSLFYRYIPDVPGKLGEGGKLQALSIDGYPGFATHNWSRSPDIHANQPLPVRWITLSNVDSAENDLRERGAELGAATFARGEGLCSAGDNFAFTCTIGGQARLGQIFGYWPSPFEGTPEENHSPGHLVLIAEASEHSLLKNGDNIIMAPWGDLIVCEDTADQCGILGVRPSGEIYAIAENAYSNSELAGACFAPDGKTLFVNIQYPGMTLAITGPWPT